MEWYAVKGLFRWYFKETGETERFEERVVSFYAPSFEDALIKAKKEADEYCVDDPKSNVNIESLGLFNAYAIGDDELKEGVELFSETYKTTLNTSEYLEKYYPENGKRS